MTLYGIDVANYQKGLKTAYVTGQGYSFMIAKATEGRGVKDPSYKRFLGDAKARQLPFAAYHFLRSDSTIAAQVSNLAAQITDKSVPVMIDCEVAGASRPTLAMCEAFAEGCKAKGIRVSMLYLPRFWWQQIGKPSLKDWNLVQALYGNNPTGYASATYPGDNSPRWAPMGGVTPSILQFGSNGKIDGYSGRVDVDAFRGTRDELHASKLFQNWIKASSNEPASVKVMHYDNIKVETRQTIPLNTWTDIDLGDLDWVTPPVGSNDWWVQVHLHLGTLVGASRNDLRYIKGRWARYAPGGADANKEGLDTHGTDTKAIPADLPKTSWQSAWSTDMKGREGVPVKFQVYIGSMVDGTVESPMRLFTVDDETT